MQVKNNVVLSMCGSFKIMENKFRPMSVLTSNYAMAFVTMCVHSHAGVSRSHSGTGEESRCRSKSMIMWECMYIHIQ